MAPRAGRARGGMAAALAAGLLSAGCGSRAPEPAVDPDALRVATTADLLGRVQAATAGWQRDHPEVKLEVVSLPAADFPAAMLPRLHSGAGAPDALVVDADFLARVAGSGVLEDLARPPYSAAPLLAEAVPAAVAQGRFGEAQLGFPAEGAPAVLFYRADLLERAGVPEAALSGSWEGLVAACARVRAATGAYCTTGVAELAELALRAARGSGSPWFGPGGEPLPDAAAAAGAIRLARAAQAADVAAGVPVGSPSWTELLKAGRLAAQVGGPAMARWLRRLDPAGAWRAAPLPGGAVLATPAAFWAVATRGAHRARAWDLLRAAVSPAAELAAWQETGALPASRAAARDPQVDAPVGALGGQVVGPAWRAAAAALPDVPRHRLDTLAADAFRLELDHAVQRGKDPDEAVAAARAEIARRLRRQR